MTDAASPPPPPPGYDPIADERLSDPVTSLGAALAAWEDGRCVLRCPIGPAVLNRQGVVHGGSLATLLDTACGYAGIYCPYPGRRRRAVTLTLSLSFLNAVSDGVIVAEARVVRSGREIFFSEAEARLEGGDARVLATSTGVFKRLRGSERLFGEPRLSAAPQN